MEVGLLPVSVEQWHPPIHLRFIASRHLGAELQEILTAVSSRGHLHIQDARYCPFAILSKDVELVGVAISVDELGVVVHSLQSWLPFIHIAEKIAEDAVG